jgi:hypothetical protein
MTPHLHCRLQLRSRCPLGIRSSVLHARKHLRGFTTRKLPAAPEAATASTVLPIEVSIEIRRLLETTGTAEKIDGTRNDPGIIRLTISTGKARAQVINGPETRNLGAKRPAIAGADISHQLAGLRRAPCSIRRKTRGPRKPERVAREFQAINDTWTR